MKTQKQCDRLASALEEFLGSELRIKDDDDRIYLCLGSWCEAGTGRMVNGEECDSLNQQFNYGIIHYTPIVSQSGKMVESSHSVSVYRIKEFISFLRECGGFQIW